MKTVLITGASDGIGKSITLKLAAKETALILFGRNEEKLKSVAEEAEKNGAKVYTHAFDLTDDVVRTKIVSGILDSHDVDVLVNNAGIWHKAGDLTTLDEEMIKQVIETNLTSHILLTRQLLGSMRGREGTAIINIISKSGTVPQLGQTVYTASKYGMKGFTDVLREDTNAEPIRIGAVYQSGTKTNMFKKSGEEFGTDHFTDPDDLADVIKFMLSRPKNIWLNEVRVAY